MKNRLLVLAAIAEAATGLALLVVPSLVGRLLFGAELSGASVVIGRVTGIALIALGIGCWPGSTALRGMLTYSALATLYLLVSWHPRRMGRASSVAGSCIACGPDAASRTGLVQTAREITARQICDSAENRSNAATI